MLRRRSGDVCWLMLGAVTLGVAGALHRHELDLLTDSARRHKVTWLLVTGVWFGHVFDVLGPLDPFRGLARLVAKDLKSVAARPMVSA